MKPRGGWRLRDSTGDALSGTVGGAIYRTRAEAEETARVLGDWQRETAGRFTFTVVGTLADRLRWYTLK